MSTHRLLEAVPHARPPNPARQSANVWLYLAILAVLGATLFPSTATDIQSWSNCVICGERGVADAILNVALFVPLGAALALRGWSGLRACLPAALLSSVIELAQLFIPGRDSSLGDVLFNTSGALLGNAIAQVAPFWLRPPGTSSDRLAFAATTVTVVLFALTGFLLQPSPPQAVYYGQWTANLGHLAWYRGRVMAAALGQEPLPSRRLLHSDLVRELLLAGAPLHVRGIAGPRVTALAPLLSIYDDRQREVMLIGPDRDDLVFRYRTRAADLRLDQPDVRVPGALRDRQSGDTLEITTLGRVPRLCLVTNGRPACQLGFTIGQGWGLLIYPEGLPAWLRVVFNAVWMAGLVLPAGYWAQSRGAVLACVAALAASLAAIPLATGLLPCPLREVTAAAGGLLLGVAFRSRITAGGIMVSARLLARDRRAL